MAARQISPRQVFRPGFSPGPSLATLRQRLLENPVLARWTAEREKREAMLAKQQTLARCVVPNAKGDLRPGLFVNAEIAIGETDAPVTVRLAAIQTWQEKPVVFVEDGDVFAAREVELGAKDSERVEILSGLLPGDKYVSDNSFILKAELGKGEAGDND